MSGASSSKSARSTAASRPKASGNGGATQPERRASTRSGAAPPSPEAIAAAKLEQQLAHNRNLAPLQEILAQHPCGVVPFSLSDGEGSPVRRLAEFLQQNWHGDMLVVQLKGGKGVNGGSDVTFRGYKGYGATVDDHNPDAQAASTLMIQPRQLARASEGMPGFAEFVDEVRAILEHTFGRRFSLLYAHILKQSQELNGATTFDVHLDTKDTDAGTTLTHTAITKLTTDAPGDEPSRMEVIGAGGPFTYGQPAGSGAIIRADSYHKTVIPKHQRVVLKMATFFRAEPLPSVSQRESPASRCADRRSGAAESPIWLDSAASSPAKPSKSPTSVPTRPDPRIAAWILAIDTSALAPHLLPRAAGAPARMGLAELASLLASGSDHEVVGTVRTVRGTLGTHELKFKDLRSCCGRSWVTSHVVGAYAALVARAAGRHVGALPSFFVPRLTDSPGGCVAFRHHSPIFAQQSRAAHAVCVDAEPATHGL